MTIVNVTEDWKNKESEKSLQDGITGTRYFNVYSDTTDETEGNVYAAVEAIAPIGGYFPGTIIAQCHSQRAKQNQDSRDVWYVTCQYKSILNQIEQSRIDYPNPLDRAAKITWSSRTVMQAVTRLQQARGSLYFTYHDWDPTALPFDGTEYSYANAAGDPFDPPAEVPITQWLATVTKNITAPPTWFRTYDNAVNDADFTLDGLTVAKGCGKLEGIKLSEPMKENGTPYRQLSFNIIVASPRAIRGSETVAPEPWDIEVLNEGMRKPGALGWTNISDSAGNPVSKPVPLDFAGLPISPGGSPIAETSLYWMLFRPFNRKPFSVLPLT